MPRALALHAISVLKTMQNKANTSESHEWDYGYDIMGVPTLESGRPEALLSGPKRQKQYSGFEDGNRTCINAHGLGPTSLHSKPKHRQARHRDQRPYSL